MQVRVQKWENGLAVLIPQPLADNAKVREGAMVDLSVSGGKVIIAPLRDKTTSLDEMLERINEDNLHGEVDTGPPQGREIW